MAKHIEEYVVEYNYRDDPKNKCVSTFLGSQNKEAYDTAEQLSKDPHIQQVRLFRQNTTIKTTALRTWTNGKHR